MGGAGLLFRDRRRVDSSSGFGCSSDCNDLDHVLRGTRTSSRGECDCINFSGAFQYLLLWRRSDDDGGSDPDRYVDQCRTALFVSRRSLQAIYFVAIGTAVSTDIFFEPHVFIAVFDPFSFDTGCAAIFTEAVNWALWVAILVAFVGVGCRSIIALCI